MSLFDHCPGSKRIKTPYPEEIKCFCGEGVEIWSDETTVECKRCKRVITREMLPSCLDWCSMAKECVGKEKYKNYEKAKKLKERGKK